MKLETEKPEIKCPRCLKTEHEISDSKFGTQNYQCKNCRLSWSQMD
jgi:transposase-like protein